MQVYRIGRSTAISSSARLFSCACKASDVDFSSKDNYIFVDDFTAIEKAEKISFLFRGEGNILILEAGCEIKSLSVSFSGDNSLALFEGGSRFPLYVHVSLGCDSVFVLRKKFRMSPYGDEFKVVVAERRNVLIGRGALVSNSVVLRSGDSHGLYSLETSERINCAADIVIGDHVWLGEAATILKGSKLESGSVIGTRSVWVGNRLPANSVGAGNPGKVIRRDVFWENPGLNFRDKLFLEERRFSSNDKKFDYRKRRMPKWISGVISMDRSLPAADKMSAIYGYLKKTNIMLSFEE